MPAPHTLGLDADGLATGAAAHLMTLLPGAVDVDRVTEGDLAALAAVLGDIHAVRVEPMPRAYQSWAWEEKYVVPRWAADPSTWERAFGLLREDPPAHDPVFLHRDFHLRNVLWAGGALSGVVDWVETSTGPAWLDVAHCCTNLALDHGHRVAERFEAAYSAATGRAPEPWWDVLDVVGFLARPGTPDVCDDPGRLARLDARLAWAVAACG